MEEEYEAFMHTNYIKYLFMLYELEKEGLDMGNYPTYPQFLRIYHEEVKAQSH
jgi:hypothetical protein